MYYYVIVLTAEMHYVFLRIYYSIFKSQFDLCLVNVKKQQIKGTNKRVNIKFWKNVCA